MTTPILATKLYIPPPRPDAVFRSRLVEQLDDDLCLSPAFARKLTLISAPAGFGKTTLISEWIAGCERPAAWLSLDEEDSDSARFLTYLIAALRTVVPQVGESVLGALQSPQPPPTEAILTTLVNDLTASPGNLVLVLDDYHVIDAPQVDDALTFLVEHLPPQLHLVITTREDPDLPLARLRVRGQLTELRVDDLRFTHAETTEFLNRVMGLNISTADVAALETRTEGWIAGLQLAAISMQGHGDTTTFIQSFTGSHRFVMDYLVEEVLHQQPAHVQTFLLYTSILDRLCGPLCDAVLLNESGAAQAALAHLEQANLFLVPLDNERRWYRYHHLFAELLRQQLRQSADASSGHTEIDDAELHIRASVWYEENGFELDAFHHAAVADDIERAWRLIENTGVPLYFRGAAHPIRNWLESLSKTVLDNNPALWVLYGWVAMATFENAQAEPKLQAAEAALQKLEPDDSAQDSVRDLAGRIAALRAMLAANHYQSDMIIAQSQRALELLHPNNLYMRTVVMRTLAIAYQFRGERAAARAAYAEAIAMSEASGNLFVNILATTGLGIVQLSDNQLHQAAESYQRALELIGDPDQPMACSAYLGLARIHYEWNDLDRAQQYGEQSVQLARQIDIVDVSASGELFLAKLALAQGDVAQAAALLAELEQVVYQRGFVRQIPAVAAAQVHIMLHRGDVTGAAYLAQAHDLPLSQARVYRAQGDPAKALSVLERYRQQMEAKGWHDERLKAIVLEMLAHDALGETDMALRILDEALSLAAPGGLMRTFVDEGPPMQHLLFEASARGIMPGHVTQLLVAFEAETQKHNGSASLCDQPLVESLSQRELEVLRLIADGLSNREIGEQLFLAQDTVKGHNRRIYGKLDVQRRTEAVARAREIGLL
ncbi:LuxR C-terminal-related transcriptional regulator [Aggregatilinea lenta]|uniref:LuxR C-terminal-related transcriptional regulator n=1 Tax=Aggregatilinea lenta TaxID=913108 RepID=UPI000E5A3C9B|nr:LuxR C-terminal-related transcriptional regulator [Aggregatilinea lenta]